MIRKLSFVLLIVMTLPALLSVYTSCTSAVGFDSTNPLSSKNTIAGNPLNTTTYKLLNGLCEAVNRCHPTSTRETCVSELKQLSGFDIRLHLPPSYSTPEAIMNGEFHGVIGIDNSNLNTCITSLQNLSCSSIELKTAYDPKSVNAYLGAPNLLGTNPCANVFSFKPAYACEHKVFLVNSENTSLNPKEITTGISYSVNPDLPAGLKLDSQTGVVSGSPLSPFSTKTFTIYAKSPAGISSTPLQLTGAEGFNVNDLGDESNMSGVICSTSSGKCTLRAAIEAANNSASSKVILLPAGRIVLLQEKQLLVTKGIEFYGDCEAGTIIDGQNKTNIIQITAGPSLLDHLTIQNGKTTDKAGAGVLIRADNGTFITRLNHVNISNNSNNGGSSGMAIGAGIAAFGLGTNSRAILTMDYCIVANNTNTDGNFGSGMGLWYNTEAVIQRSYFKTNWSTGYGGAISSHSGNLKVFQSLFEGNHSETGGGAIFIDHYAKENSNIENSTFSNNFGRDGGAIYLGAMTMKILNSTFYANEASSVPYGGALVVQAAKVILQNNLFSKNNLNAVPKNCEAGSPSQYESWGNNLSDTDSSDCLLGNSMDIIDPSIPISSLADHGGPTYTHALVPNSLADSGANASACPQEDQRGAPRLQDGTCAIGAFQLSKKSQ